VQHGDGVDAVQLPRGGRSAEALGDPRAQPLQRRVGTGRGHHRGDHPLPPLGVRAAEDHRVGDVGVLAQRRLDRERRDVDPAGDDDVVQPAVHGEVAPGIEAAGVAGAEPAVGEGGGGALGVAAVAVREHRAGQPHAVAGHRHLHPLQRTAVVHAAARGLGHAVGGHHGDALGAGAVQQRGVGGRAAHQDRVEGAQRGGLGVQGAAQLGGHQRGVAAAHRHAGDRRGQCLAALQHGGRHAAEHAAAEHLQPGDGGDGQREQPAARPAEPVEGGGRRGAQRAGRQQHAAAAAGGPRGHDDEVGGRLQGLVGPQHRPGGLDGGRGTGGEHGQRGAALEAGAHGGGDVGQHGRPGHRRHEGEASDHDVPA
jgi:hypothetical protein